MAQPRNPEKQIAIDEGKASLYSPSGSIFSEFGRFTAYKHYEEGCRPESVLAQGVGVVLVRLADWQNDAIRHEFEFGHDPENGESMVHVVGWRRFHKGDRYFRSVMLSGRVVLPSEIAVGEQLSFGLVNLPATITTSSVVKSVIGGLAPLMSSQDLRERHHLSSD